MSLILKVKKSLHPYTHYYNFETTWLASARPFRLYETRRLCRPLIAQNRAHLAFFPPIHSLLQHSWTVEQSHLIDCSLGRAWVSHSWISTHLVWLCVEFCSTGHILLHFLCHLWWPLMASLSTSRAAVCALCTVRTCTKEFSWTFLLSPVAFPILGADFLSNFRLLVDNTMWHMVASSSS